MKKRISTLVVLLLIAAIVCSLTATLTACKKGDTDTDSNEQTEKQTQEDATVITVDELSIGILSDIHVMSDEIVQDVTNPDYIQYCNNVSNTKMNELSTAILNTSADKFIAKGVDVVFMIGDLTNDGTKESLQVVADTCKRLEDAGITVFVTNGICDTGSGSCGEWLKTKCGLSDEEGTRLAIFSEDVSAAYDLEDEELYAMKFLSGSKLDFVKTATNDDFVSIFQDYGFNEALSCDTNSLSYATDIPGTNYRLIVLDNASYYYNDYNDRLNLSYAEAPTMPAGEMDWLNDTLVNIKILGKEPIVITNIPLDPYPVSIYTDFLADAHLSMKNGDELEELFAEYGVKYIFSGHSHMNAVNDIETKNGTLTEVYTSNTTTYPCSVRCFDIAKDYTYTTSAEEIDKLNGDYINDENVSPADKLAATTGFKAYAESRFKSALTSIFTKNLTRRGDNADKPILLHFLTDMGIYPTKDEAKDAIIEELSDDVWTWAQYVNDMQIYGEGDTIEAVCASYGITLPASRYNGYNVRDFVMNIFMRMIDNRFELLHDGADSKIFTCIFQVGMLKLCDLDLFGKLSQVNSVIRDCDMTVMVEDFLATGNMDLTKDDFILALLSVLFPTLDANYHIKLNPTDSKALLSVIANYVPLLNTVISDLELFCNEEGKLETSAYSLSNGIIYGQPFVEDILFSILARTCAIH